MCRTMRSSEGGFTVLIATTNVVTTTLSAAWLSQKLDYNYVTRSCPCPDLSATDGSNRRQQLTGSGVFSDKPLMMVKLSSWYFFGFNLSVESVGFFNPFGRCALPH